MIRDHRATGVTPLTDKNAEKCGFKNLVLPSEIGGKDYVLEWEPFMQSYKMGIRDNGITTWFCWDIKFVHELERLVVGLMGE